MNIFRPLLFGLLLCQTVFTSAQSYVKGQKDLNIGFGLGSHYYRHLSVYSNYGSTPVLSASLDIGITDEISLGGYFGFATSHYDYNGQDFCSNGNGGNYYYYTDTYRWSFYMIGVRGLYHFGKLIPNDKLDLYAGLMLGDNFAKQTWSTNAVCPGHHSFYSSSYYGGFIFTGLVGCRYFFKEKLGAFAELGYGVSYLTLGVNLKF